MNIHGKVTLMPAGSTIIGPGRVENPTPSDYRLAKKPDGTLVLQGAHFWQQGQYSGYEWRDIPTVET